jgi:hypothetical protein
MMRKSQLKGRQNVVEPNGFGKGMMDPKQIESLYMEQLMGQIQLMNQMKQINLKNKNLIN